MDETVTDLFSIVYTLGGSAVQLTGMPGR